VPDSPDDLPVFDPARRAELEAALGPGWLDDLRGPLAEGLAELVEALRAAAAGGDPDALRRAVHSLRGTAANYGCARLEAAAAAVADGGAAAVGAVERAYAATAAALTPP